MRIGFDVSQTGASKAGCGFYAHALACRLPSVNASHRYDFYPDFGDFFFDPRMPLRNPYEGSDCHWGPRHLTREGAASFWNDAGLEQALGHPDVVHSNNFWCPVQFTSTRLVYTLHDMGFLLEPSWTTEANRVGCFSGVFRAAMAADWIVAVSEASRSHFLRVFPHFAPDRVRVIHQCSRFDDASAEGTRPAALEGIEARSFWLCVGTIEPRKNQRALARAYARYLDDGGRPMPLVFAGGKGWRMDDFPGYLERLGVSGSVVFTGYVSDMELVWLYRNCHANLYPSLFEGFGLPVLEGMQFGAATVCSSSSSLPEVAGDAAWLVDPADEEGWASALMRLAEQPSLRDTLAEQGRARAQAFDWRDSTRRLLELYEEAQASPRRNA